MKHERFSKYGLRGDGFDYVVALAGNPNTGKSTVFNAFTGLRQHTGNWPGKTVTRAEGTLKYNNRRYKIVDLPGTYSLLTENLEEEITRDFLLFGRPDVTVIIVDATNLERNLNLVLQILEITPKAVVCLNLIDEAERRGIEIDAVKLSNELGVPAMPTAARSKRGLVELASAIEKVATGELKTEPRRIALSREIEEAVNELVPQIEREFPGLPNARWLAIRLIDGDKRIIEAMQSGEFAEWLEHGKQNAHARELVQQEALS